MFMLNVTFRLFGPKCIVLFQIMAPTPNKTRMAKCREERKKNQEQWKAYLEKDKLRKRKVREKEKNELTKDKKLLAEKRQKDKERQRLYREKKKVIQNGDQSELGSYKSPRTLGKAVKRIKNSLPNSPTKKVAIIRKLVRENLSSELKKDIFNAKKTGPRKIQSDCLKRVNEFLQCNEISRQAPGKRNVKSVKDPVTGKRSLYQLRHMVMGIGEAYEEYKLLYPHDQISKSKFYSLRPKHVLPVSDMPHTVCVCIKHANFTFMTETLSKVAACFPKTNKEVLNEVCCDTDDKKCMLNVCNECTYDIRTLLPEAEDLKKKIKWTEWKNVDNRPQLVENFTSLHRLIISLNSQLRGFKTHTYIKRVQSAYFEFCKENVKSLKNEAVMQVDFAENYSLIQQDEIQSAHWSHSQVAIFTCCIWHSDKVYSFGVISDDLKHSKNSVWVFMKAIISEMKKIAPSVDHIILFSDNCAGQFKSRYTVSSVCFSEADFGVSMQWNFFASGHGKGAVDGVGGSIKRSVWREVQGRRSYVYSPYDFFKLADEKCKGIHLLYVPQSEVDSYKNHLDQRWLILKEITGINSMHHFQAYDNKNILIGKTSGDLMTKV